MSIRWHCTGRPHDTTVQRPAHPVASKNIVHSSERACGEGIAVDPQRAGLADHLVAKDVRQERGRSGLDQRHVDLHDLGRGPDHRLQLGHLVGAVGGRMAVQQVGLQASLVDVVQLFTRSLKPRGDGLGSCPKISVLTGRKCYEACRILLSDQPTGDNLRLAWGKRGVIPPERIARPPRWPAAERQPRSQPSITDGAASARPDPLMVAIKIHQPHV